MMKRVWTLFFAVLMAVCVVGQNYKEDDNLDGLLCKVMDKIEAKSRYIPTISGAIQIGYLLNAVPAENNYTNSFTFNTARLNVKGNPLDWFNYNMQIDFANKVRVLDFNLDFHPLAHLNLQSQYLNIWAGQSKTPLTMESQLGPAVFEAVSYTQVIQALCGYSQQLTPELTNMAGGRDIGLAVYGYALRVPWGGEMHDLFEYKLGVYNGSGMNCLDQDVMKDVSGCLYLHPIKAITVGGSFYIGAYNRVEKTPQAKDTLLMTRRDRYAVSFRYDDKEHWLARAEYVYGRTHDRRSDGWYGMLQYTINPNKSTKNQWSVMAKYDAYRDWCNYLPDYCNHQFICGVNYRPMRWLYVQAHYGYKMECERHKVKVHRHYFQTTACLIF
jgi:hypothetical protein